MDKKAYLIGVTGGSGSGKTTFINNVRAMFPDNEVCIISQDDYYRPREQQEVDKVGKHNFDLPKSFYRKAFFRDIRKLTAGEVVTRKEYTFNNEKKDPKILTFHPAPIIIVEGLFVFHFKKIRKSLDLRIYLHAKENLKVIRRIRRDRLERNYPMDDVLYRYEHHVLPTFEKYIKPYKDDADMVINNNLDFNAGLEVFIGFLKQKLEELKGN
jgi:uridine kinase